MISSASSVVVLTPYHLLQGSCDHLCITQLKRMHCSCKAALWLYGPCSCPSVKKRHQRFHVCRHKHQVYRGTASSTLAASLTKCLSGTAKLFVAPLDVQGRIWAPQTGLAQRCCGLSQALGLGCKQRVCFQVCGAQADAEGPPAGQHSPRGQAEGLDTCPHHACAWVSGRAGALFRRPRDTMAWDASFQQAMHWLSARGFPAIAVQHGLTSGTQTFSVSSCFCRAIQRRVS